MLELGHFSFTQESRRGESTQLESWHGYFACVAEADEVEAALKKFKATRSRVWSGFISTRASRFTPYRGAVSSRTSA
jgi:hypothetical protein